MESVLMGHPERNMPFCIQDIQVAVSTGTHESGAAGQGSTAMLTHATTRVVSAIIGNHQTRRTITLDAPLTTDHLELAILTPSINVPAALFAVRCYS
jgi:hypothetical protein